MKEDKYTKSLAKNEVYAILHMRDIRKNVLPKFIMLCMATPCLCPFQGHKYSLRCRHSKGKWKGIRARDHGRERREEENACKEAIVFAIPPTNLKNNKNNATVND